jgi:hypothetical protein
MTTSIGTKLSYFAAGGVGLACILGVAEESAFRRDNEQAASPRYYNYPFANGYTPREVAGQTVGVLGLAYAGSAAGMLIGAAFQRQGIPPCGLAGMLAVGIATGASIAVTRFVCQLDMDHPRDRHLSMAAETFASCTIFSVAAPTIHPVGMSILLTSIALTTAAAEYHWRGSGYAASAYSKCVRDYLICRDSQENKK